MIRAWEWRRDLAILSDIAATYAMSVEQVRDPRVRSIWTVRAQREAKWLLRRLGRSHEHVAQVFRCSADALPAELIAFEEMRADSLKLTQRTDAALERWARAEQEDRSITRDAVAG